MEPAVYYDYVYAIKQGVDSTSRLQVIYQEVIYYYPRRSYQEVILLPGDPIKRRLQSATGHLSRGDLLRGLFYIGLSTQASSTQA